MLDPVVLPDGQVIDKPGRYIMSMDWYHSQCCAGPSISSSGLRKLHLESPADFWAYSDLNEHRFEREEIDAFTFGRAAHALLLGEEDFNAKFAVVPGSAPPEPLASQIQARKEGRVSKSAEERFAFWDGFYAETEGKALLKEEQLLDIMCIRDALETHEIVPILLQGDAEHSLIWQDDRTGVWLKSRLDILSATGDYADLKSTAQKDPRLIRRDIQKHGYDMQLGLATMAVEQVLGVPFTPEDYEQRSGILLFVYKKPPYHVIPVELSFDALHWARLKCRAAIDKFAHCMKTGEWPGPVSGILTYDIPEWEVDQLGDLQAAGIMPNSL